MKSWHLKYLRPVLVLAILFFVSAPLAFGSQYNSDELTRRIKTGAYLQKTDNVMIIIDGLGHKRKAKMKLAKELMVGIGDTIPAIPHTRMLRMFGPDAADFESDYSTIFGMYNSQGLNLKNYTPVIATKTAELSLFDPLGFSFINATTDLGKLPGRHAVILISDGKSFERSSLAESAYLKKKFGGSICYYPIIVGNDSLAVSRMEKLARIGGCGFSTQATNLTNATAMTDFVEKVLFSKRRIPLKPAAVPVEEIIEVVPEDGMVTEEDATEDDIAEDDTPYIPDLVGDTVEDEVIILERELPHDKVITIELHVEFDLNKATVKDAYDADIKKVADFMIKYPETEALLVGHTCNLGSEDYNLQLSVRRAEAVRNYLVNNLAIDPSRLKTHGAGELEPIADNSTEEGRIQNRRVMAVISTIVTDVIIIEQEILKSDFLRDDFVLPPIEPKEDVIIEEQIVEPPMEVPPAPQVSEDPALPDEMPLATEEATEMMETEEATTIIIDEAVVPEPEVEVMETPAEVEEAVITEEPPAVADEISEEEAIEVESPPTEQEVSEEQVQEEIVVVPVEEAVAEQPLAQEVEAEVTAPADQDAGEQQLVEEEAIEDQESSPKEEAVSEQPLQQESETATAEEQPEKEIQEAATPQEEQPEVAEQTATEPAVENVSEENVAPVEESSEETAPTAQAEESNVPAPMSEEDLIDQQFEYEPEASQPLQVEAAEPVFSKPAPEEPAMPNWK